jgi:hypothetical protein
MMSLNDENDDDETATVMRKRMMKDERSGEQRNRSDRGSDASIAIRNNSR